MNAVSQLTKPHRIFVTGGAGYIGSHVVLELLELGHQVLIYDNLSTGFRLPAIDCEFVRGDLADLDLLTRTLKNGRFDAVMHFAASIDVAESVEQPLAYYRNNTANTLNLLDACQVAGVDKFIFSSTAAVYGDADDAYLDEKADLKPVNPYGTSKMLAERMIEDQAAASGLRYVTLRYFNVAGADPKGRAGQMSDNSEHLISALCKAVMGQQDEFVINGDQYQTPDGTCVRDFIHVTDLADAHICALYHLLEEKPSLTVNCGYGRGYSVAEVASATQRVSGRDFDILRGPARPGDTIRSVASCDRIKQELGWTPQHDNLEEIIQSALSWSQNKARLLATPAKKKSA